MRHPEKYYLLHLVMQDKIAESRDQYGEKHIVSEIVEIGVAKHLSNCSSDKSN